MEPVQFQLPYINGIIKIANFHGNTAILAYRKGFLAIAFGEGDFRKNLEAAAGYELPFAVNLERAVAGIGIGTVLLEDPEKTFALDGEVTDIAGILQ